MVRVGFPAGAPISTSRASLRNRVSKTQSAWGSTRAACQFESPKAEIRSTNESYAAELRISGFGILSDFGFRIFTLGSWQTSNALALQASLCGSVTHRLHQPSLEEQGCRTVAKR